MPPKRSEGTDDSSVEIYNEMTRLCLYSFFKGDLSLPFFFSVVRQHPGSKCVELKTSNCIKMFRYFL